MDVNYMKILLKNLTPILGSNKYLLDEKFFSGVWVRRNQIYPILYMCPEMFTLIVQLYVQ